MNRRSFLFSLPLLGFLPKLSKLLPTEIVEPSTGPMFVDELNAITIKTIYPAMIADICFKNTPMLDYLRYVQSQEATWDGNVFNTYKPISRINYDGGSNICLPFHHQGTDVIK